VKRAHQYQRDCMAWTKAMLECVENLLPDEKAELEEWDHRMVTGDGRFATSDWPGFEKHIGLPPWRLA
jgi:hypothetical protein